MGKLHTADSGAIAAAMGAGVAFETNGALRGVPGPAGFLATGCLDAAWHGDVGEADYVVYSWATPIAWHRPGIGWVRPLVAYSRSTTRHQGTVDAAIGRVAPCRVDDPAYVGARVRRA